MRLTFTSGDQQIDISIRGGRRRALRAATEAALQLLTDVPPDEPDEPAPFGFTGTKTTDGPDET